MGMQNYQPISPEAKSNIIPIAYLWYGASKYESRLSEQTQDLFIKFLESARRDLSRNSGGFALDEPDMGQIWIAGNGWSIESSKPV